MNTPWHGAMAEIERRCGGIPAEELLDRVEVRKDGTLYLHACVDQVQRWFRAVGNRFEEIFPAQDDKLPLLQKWSKDLDLGRIEILSWRPRRRIALRVNGCDESCIVKGFVRGKGSLARQRHLQALRCAGEDSFRIPQLLPANLGGDHLAMQLMRGENPDLQADAGALFERIGSCLRSFQDAGKNMDLPLHNRQAELLVLDRLAGRVMGVLRTLPQDWSRVRASLDARIQPADAMTPVATHRDLHDRQFLHAEGRPVLLDFDLLCLGEPALDPANLYAHLFLRAVQSGDAEGPERAGAVGARLLEGLQRQHQPGFSEGMSFYLATTLLRLALVYRIRPRWSGLADGLVRQAENSLRCLESVVLPPC